MCGPTSRASIDKLYTMWTERRGCTHRVALPLQPRHLVTQLPELVVQGGQQRLIHVEEGLCGTQTHTHTQTETLHTTQTHH